MDGSNNLSSQKKMKIFNSDSKCHSCLVKSKRKTTDCEETSKHYKLDGGHCLMILTAIMIS